MLEGRIARLAGRVPLGLCVYLGCALMAVCFWLTPPVRVDLIVGIFATGLLISKLGVLARREWPVFGPFSCVSIGVMAGASILESLAYPTVWPILVIGAPLPLCEAALGTLSRTSSVAAVRRAAHRTEQRFADVRGWGWLRHPVPGELASLLVTLPVSIAALTLYFGFGRGQVWLVAVAPALHALAYPLLAAEHLAAPLPLESVPPPAPADGRADRGVGPAAVSGSVFAPSMTGGTWPSLSADARSPPPAAAGRGWRCYLACHIASLAVMEVAVLVPGGCRGPVRPSARPSPTP